MPAKILDCTVDAYHAREEFSSSIAKTLISRSPLHAKADIGKPPTKGMDRGAIIHRLSLGKGAAYQIVKARDWRTDKAKAERDRARADGLVPVLEDDFAEYALASEHVRVGLAERGFILDGASELAILWTEQTTHGPVECKAMLDHVWLERGRVLDLKITEDAGPAAIERSAENLGYAIQSAAYSRALAALDPGLAGRIKFLFAFCEPDAPHAINVTQPDGVFRELGERRWLRAVEAWGECIKNNHWPAYGTGVNTLSSPAWALSREELAA